MARAKKDNGAIINADVMQCYDALPILSAQPTSEEREDIPHWLYSVVDATARISAADWVKMATWEIDTAYENGYAPYIVGGTGMYIKALMDGLSPMPDIPDDVRAAVRAREKEQGLAAIYADLQIKDPVIAARLKPGDTQRILRAMEVVEATGTPLSEWQAAPLMKPERDWQFHVVQLRPEKEAREIKIRKRLENMLAAGALDEIKALSDRIDKGEVPDDAPIIIAHGFRPFRDALKGKMTMEDAMEQTAIETRQYTKRQMTWLRHQIRADEVI